MHTQSLFKHGKIKIKIKIKKGQKAAKNESNEGRYFRKFTVVQ